MALDNHNTDYKKDSFTNIIIHNLEKDISSSKKNGGSGRRGIIGGEDEEESKKGWIILQGHPKKMIHSSINQPSNTPSQIDPNVLAKRAFNKLTKNYENWKANYIQMWGYEEYERHYCFPNHDYDYFDVWAEDKDLLYPGLDWREEEVDTSSLSPPEKKEKEKEKEE